MSIDEPKETVILIKWSRIDMARRFSKSEDLRVAMKRPGVMDKPDIYFLGDVAHGLA